MKEKLEELIKNSYAPYSKYHVASIVVTKDGKEFNGVNFENASYGATICAERNAIGNAISNGYTKGDFKEIFVMTETNDEPGTCCFICRQVLTEFFDKDAKVTCMNSIGEKKEFTISQLCPHPFDESNLK